MLIATLSVAVTLNVIVWYCELVLTTTVSSSTVKAEIDGSVLSDLLTVIVTLAVELLPAASVAVQVTTSSLLPNE